MPGAYRDAAVCSSVVPTGTWSTTHLQELIILATCENIVGLQLDSESLAAIERIKKRSQAGQLLAMALSAGVLNSIFTKSNAANAAWNISQTDWQMYSQAMRSIPDITRTAIRNDAQQMQLTYNMRNNRKLEKFWEGVANGCQ